MNATGYFSTNIIYKQVQFQTVSFILINIQSHLQKLESKLKEIMYSCQKQLFRCLFRDIFAHAFTCSSIFVFE